MRAKINGLDMAYDVRGAADAPVVVLHHPLATNMSFWDEAVAALEKTYRVVRFDARGHGATEAPVGRYDFKTLADDVVGLMDHLGVTRAQFGGLSMGGMVAQFLGLDHGARFSSICIVSSSSKTAEAMRHLWSDRLVVAREKGMGSQVEPAMQRWLAKSAREGRPDLVARCTQMIETTPLEGYAGWCGAIELLDMTDKLAGIKVPTKIIVGAEDPATPVAASETIQRHIPSSELAILPGVSHMLAIENPSFVYGGASAMARRTSGVTEARSGVAVSGFAARWAQSSDTADAVAQLLLFRAIEDRARVKRGHSSNACRLRSSSHRSRRRRILRASYRTARQLRQTAVELHERFAENLVTDLDRASVGVDVLFSAGRLATANP